MIQEEMYEAVQMSVNPKVIEHRLLLQLQKTVLSFAKRVTVRANIDRRRCANKPLLPVLVGVVKQLGSAINP